MQLNPHTWYLDIITSLVCSYGNSQHSSDALIHHKKVSPQVFHGQIKYVRSTFKSNFQKFPAPNCWGTIHTLSTNINRLVPCFSRINHEDIRCIMLKKTHPKLCFLIVKIKNTLIISQLVHTTLKFKPFQGFKAYFVSVRASPITDRQDKEKLNCCLPNIGKKVGDWF